MPNAIHYRHYAPLCPQAKLDYPAGYRTRAARFNDEAEEVTEWMTAYQNLPSSKMRHNIQEVTCPACLIEVTTVCISQLDDLGELPIDTGDDEGE
jgi:hypothetical protein